MTAQQARNSINQVLDKVDNPAVLEAYYQILLNLMKVHDHAAIGFDSDGNPLTASDLEKEVVAASKRVKAGKFIRHEDLKKQMENW